MVRVAGVLTGKIQGDDDALAEADEQSKKLGNVIAEGAVRLSRGLRDFLETGALAELESFGGLVPRFL